MSTSPVPPPGCPAHHAGPDAAGPGGIRRLYGPEADADPKALYEKLRAEHGPVAPVLVHGDLPAWLVLGYRENLEVARTPSRFARDPRTWRDMAQGKVPPDHPLGPMVVWWPVVNFTDGPVHERLREAVMDSLQGFDRRGIRRYVTRFTHQLVDSFAGAGHADLVAEFSSLLPTLVMTQLIGAPEEAGPRMARAALDMVNGTETALESDQYVTSALQQLVAAKAERPGRDITSWLLAHQAGLAHEEVLAHVRVILIAAVQTTANLIANTLRMVLTDQRFRANLSGGHMTLPDALEQVLWDRPPINTVLGRWATGDTVLGGQQIRAGDMLLLGLAAGNVDPDPEIRPDLAAPVHGNRAHLAFSAGPHECPGQDIGRAIADTGIEVLLTRLPDLELAVPEDELVRQGSLMFQQLEALPVTFSPRSPRPQEEDSAEPEQPASAPLPPAARVPAPRVESAPVAGVPAPTPDRPWWRRMFGAR
ncbi:cytochrome P450 [Actinacidiphila yeochonensis]|uniref:cytochrome P450 n=1 Tax=Actinacidiphila yeochonensis TaxID=89050 RepID=UPI000A90BC97|nr:cytochrome P450 [Actinacidiphila yeochonensis]